MKTDELASQAIFFSFFFNLEKSVTLGRRRLFKFFAETSIISRNREKNARPFRRKVNEIAYRGPAKTFNFRENR